MNNQINYHIPIPFYEVVQIQSEGYEDTTTIKNLFPDILSAFNEVYRRNNFGDKKYWRIRLYDGEEVLEQWIIKDFSSEPIYKEFY